MSADATSDTEAVARRVFAAIARRDLPGITTCLAPEDEQHFLPVGHAADRSAVLEVFRQLFASFPDFSIEVQDVHAAGDRAYVRWRSRGTFTGVPYQGIVATGRAVEVTGVDAFIVVRDGLIVTNTIFYDGAGFLRAIGLLPGRGSLGERLLLLAFNTWTRLRRLGRS